MMRIAHAWRSLVLGPAAAAFVSVMPMTPVAAQQRPSLTERLVLCSTCHGEDGNSKMEKTPSLAGQPVFFLLNQLVLLREGVRQVEVMAPFVKDLKDEEIEAIAQHFAKLPAKASDERVDPELAKRGEALAARMRCASCHLPSLAGQEQMPRVAKQRIDYLIASMQAFRDNKRTGADTAMSASIFGATDADLTALAHYAASK